MHTDKALRKVLAIHSETMPNGLESRMMTHILVSQVKKKRRAFIMGLTMVSFVSAVLIAGGYYILNAFFSFKIKFTLPAFSINIESWSSFFFCVYIAAIVLVLLVVDTLIRKAKQKQEIN